MKSSLSNPTSKRCLQKLSERREDEYKRDNNGNDTAGKRTYFKHQEKRHQEEAEKLDAEKARMKEYKDHLIEDILKDRNDFMYEELARKPIRTLESIF